MYEDSSVYDVSFTFQFGLATDAENEDRCKAYLAARLAEIADELGMDLSVHPDADLDLPNRPSPLTTRDARAIAYDGAHDDCPIDALHTHEEARA